MSMSPLRASPDSARRLRSQRQLHALVLTVTRHSTHGQMEGKAHRTDAPAGPAGRRLPSEPRGRHLKSRSPSCRTVRCAGGGRATKALRPAPLRCVVMQTGSGGPRGGGQQAAFCTPVDISLHQELKHWPSSEVSGQNPFSDALGLRVIIKAGAPATSLKLGIPGF